MTNKERYKRAFDVLASSETISLEVSSMKNSTHRKPAGRRAAAAGFLAAAILGVCGTAYAAMMHFGILEFQSLASVEVPEDAVSQIQSAPAVVQGENRTIFQCAVREALCDSQTITLVYEVSAKEPGKYLFVPEDALPEDPMSNFSAISGRSVEEYACEKGLTVVRIGGGITNVEELGICEEAMDFRAVSDDVMDILVTCGKSEAGAHLNIKVVATAVEEGSDDVMRLESSFALQDLSTTVSTLYSNGDSTPGGLFFAVEKAEVLQTDLGTYVDVYYRSDPGSDPEQGLFFRVVDAGGQSCDTVGGAGTEPLAEGQYRQRCRLSKCEVGSELYLEGFDCFSKTVYGTVKLTLQSAG